MSPKRELLRGGYPLSALLLLMAACAVVLGMISPLVRSRAVFGIGDKELATSVAVGGLSLMTLGALLGLFHYQRLSGALWGVLVGVLAGIVAGPLILVPPRAFLAVMVSAAAGAAIIVAIAAFLRIASIAKPRGAAGRQADRAARKRHPLDPERGDSTRATPSPPCS